MNRRLAGRLQALATVEIVAVVGALILAGALFAFGSYIRSISIEINATLAQLDEAIARSSASGDARTAGRIAAAHFLPGEIEAIFNDPRWRVAAYRMHRRDSNTVVDVRPRGDLSGDPEPSGPVARSILGLATAFGLQPARAHLGPLYVTIKSNDVTLVATTRSFLLPLLVALLVATAFAYLVARTLTRQVLRPLDDVTAALQRFALGDLTPEPIAADSRQELGSLAIAYNGAIAQMQHAFAERDRANASIRQFIADAGHQLRTPLTVVRGFIAILRRADRGFEDRLHILDTMNRQSVIMGSLIEKLILLEHWESADAPLASKPIDVGVLVSDLVGPIAEANPNRAVDVATESGLLAAIDPSELGAAITNLVDNAFKYTTGAVRVAVCGDGPYVLIEVSDDGPGIAPDDATHVFDRFYRGSRRDRDVEGSGLGLPIVKRAIERAHGSIVLETDPQRGSTFTLRLPVVDTSDSPRPP